MRFILALFCVGFIVGCSNTSENSSEEQTAPESMVAAHTDASGLYQTCVACHGEKGEGNRSLGSPSIAGLDSWYIETQIHNFKKGIRGNPDDTNAAQMIAISKTIRDEDVATLASFINQMPLQSSESTITGDIQNGKAVYNMICGACHGPGAMGNQALNAPGLLGLNDWYLEKQFMDFKNGQRGSHPDDTFGAQMAAMSGTLPSENALSDIIAFISSLEK